MILIISTCKEPLHELEFVKPIEDIVKNENMKFFTKHYKDISSNDLKKVDKVIICGTSLADFDYFNHIDKFEWIKEFEKPVLGICAGIEVITNKQILGGEIWGSGKNVKDRLEIGEISVKFTKEFLGVSKGLKKVYALHQIAIRKVRKDFDVFATSNKGTQAIKHKTKPIYGILFHPEVRNKEIIVNFLKI